MPKKLLTGEQEVWPPIRKHWIVLVRGLLPASVLVLLALLLIDIPGSMVLPWQVPLLATAVALTGLGLWALWVWLNWRAALVTMTQLRVIIEEGIITRTSKIIPLDRVQDVSTKQPFVGRLLNYGELEIDTAGTVANEVVTDLHAPERLRDQIYVLSEQARKGG